MRLHFIFHLPFSTENSLRPIFHIAELRPHQLKKMLEQTNEFNSFVETSIQLLYHGSCQKDQWWGRVEVIWD